MTFQIVASVLSIIFCSFSIVLCLWYMAIGLYTAKLNNCWNWRRTEEMVIGFTALCIFLAIIWVILDIA